MCSCKSKPQTQQRPVSQVQRPVQRPLFNKGGNRRIVIRQK
jgi:hypothetical protein